MEIIYKGYKGSFIKQPKPRDPGDGRYKATTAIRKMHQGGPQQPDALIKGRDEPYRSNSTIAIRKALRHPHGIGRAAHLAADLTQIEKSLHESGHVVRKGESISGAAWNRMTWQQRRDHFQKLGSAKPRVSDREVTDNYNRGPRRSSNAQWDDVHADTGATNNFRDEATANPGAVRIAGQVIGTPSRTNLQAAVDAIKADLARGAKLMGV